VLHRLDESAKNSMKEWCYSAPYNQFNYALKKEGWIDTYCCDNNTFCYTCESEGETVGFFLFILERENEFRVLVNPAYLGCGYGKEIVQLAIRTGFEELGLKRLSLLVRKNHPVAIALYKKMGFVTVGETVETIDGEEVFFYQMLLEAASVR